MDSDQVAKLLRDAAEAVAKAKVPEPLQEAAFTEAVAALRDEAGEEARGSGGRRKKTSDRKPTEGDGQRVTGPDESTVFSNLAQESGVEERDLRDILQVKKDGEVHVTTPTKNLGESIAEQARTVIALVSGAHAHGLEESPVDANAVRKELKRKHCYQSYNFASKHLRPLKGFNAGSNNNEIVLTSKWVEEFKAAVDKAHGRAAEEDASESS